MDKKVLNLERIGMQFCPGGSGSGRNDGEVCQGYGGIGFVSKKSSFLKGEANKS